MALSPEELEQAFFKQVALAYDDTLQGAVAAVRGVPGTDDYFESRDALLRLRERLVDPEDVEAFEAALAESLRIFAHSFFAILDGAASPQEERVVAAGLDGQRLRPGLHEYWVDYLFDTGRQT
jgi:hypothetical protein